MLALESRDRSFDYGDFVGKPKSKVELLRLSKAELSRIMEIVIVLQTTSTCALSVQMPCISAFTDRLLSEYPRVHARGFRLRYMSRGMDQLLSLPLTYLILGLFSFGGI